MKVSKKIYKKTDQGRVEGYWLLLKMKFLVQFKTTSLKFKIILMQTKMLTIIILSNKNIIMG